MAETLRELVVRLSLDSSNFSRNMRTISQQIKEAESTFNLAGAGIQNFGSTVQGQEAKLSMLKSKLDMQKAAVKQYTDALKAAETKLQANMKIHQQYATNLDVAKARHEQLGQKVEQAREKYDRLAQTLGTTNATTRTAADELKRAEQAYKTSGDQVKKLEGQVAATSKTLQNNADQVSKLQTGLNNANAALKETESQIGKTEKELQRLSSTFTQIGSALTNFSQKAAAISRELTSVGKGLTTHLTAPIAALGTMAVKSAVSFESAMAGVRKTLPRDAGPEGKAMENLSKRIQDLSLETASTAEEIAGVVEMAGQLGIAYGQNGDTIMDFAKTMVMLGDSTDMAAQDAASSAARFFNIMGTAPDMYNNYGAAITDLGNNFATTESEIVEMSMRLAGAGKQVGLSESEILGFATALSSVGIKAQMGGSAFSKALVNMELAVETGNKQLASFAEVSGMTAEQFSATWREKPAAAFQAFINGLARYSEDEGNSAIAFLQDMGLKEIRLRDTTLRLAASTDLVADAQNMANAAWRNADVSGQNALVNEATKRYQTMASKLVQLKNKALMFARTVGADLTPTLTVLMDAVSNLIDKFLGMDEGTRVVIERFAMVAAAVGPAILIIGKLIGTAGSVAGVLGKLSTALGTVSAASQAAGGGMAAMAGGLSLATAGYAALGVAAVAGAKLLYDYASGAKALRDEVSQLNTTAKDWKKTEAETFYNNAGMSTFGLSADQFKQSRTQAKRWVDDVTRIWSNGEKKNKETVSNWTDSYKNLTNDTRTALKGLQQEAKDAGKKSLSREMGKDLKTLDSIDRQVTNLLKKKTNGKLTDKEKIKLEDLIEKGDAIRVKYKLEPQDPTNKGYEDLKKNLNAEVARLQASGASQKEITDTYGKAAAAAAQGYKQVKDQMDENYRARYKEIQQIEDQGEREKALAELNSTYQSDRKKAAQEYAQVLSETYGPVLKEQQEGGQAEQLQKAADALGKYKEALETGDTEGQAKALETLNNLNLDESQLTEYYAALTQIQSLMDEGLVSEDQVKELFPEADINTAMTNLAAIQQTLNELGADENLSGLKTMIGEALPQEVQKILIGLDMTQAAADWKAFADNPGLITTEAKISKLSKDNAEGTNLVIDGVIGYLGSLLDKVPAEEKPKIESLIGYLKTVQNDPSGVESPTIEGLLGYIQRVREQAAGAIKPSIQGLTGYIHTLQEKEGGAAKPTIEGLIAYLSSVEEKQGGATKPDIQGLIGYLTSIQDSVSAEQKPAIQSLIGYLTKVSEKEGGAEKPAISGMIGYLQTVLNGGGDIQAASLPAILGLVGYLSSVDKGTDYTGPDLSDLNSLIAYISEYKNAPGYKPPEPPPVAIAATIGLSNINKTALAIWRAQNPVEATMQLKVGNMVNSVDELFNKENVKFYEGGVEVPLSPNVQKKVTKDDIVVVDADGTMHVIITPELGSPESLDITKGNIEDKLGKDNALVNALNLTDSTQDKVDQINVAAKGLQEYAKAKKEALEAGDTSNLDLFNQQENTYLNDFNRHIQELDDADIQNIATRAADLMTALNSGTGTPEQIESWKAELESLQTVIQALEPEQFSSSGSQIGAGLAAGMEGYDFTSTATNVKDRILQDINTALGVSSPATTMKPTGGWIAAGIGAGMLDYMFDTDAEAVASNAKAALDLSMSGYQFELTGRKTPEAIARGMKNYVWTGIANVLATKANNALKKAFDAKKDSFISVGVNISKGIATGIRRGQSEIINAVISAIDKAIQAALAKNKIESPSKLWRDEVGVYMAKGMAVGFSDESERQIKTFTNSLDYLADSAHGEARQVSTSNDNRQTFNNQQSFQVVQNIYGDTTSYAAQQREAAKAFVNATRRM